MNLWARIYTPLFCANKVVKRQSQESQEISENSFHFRKGKFLWKTTNNLLELQMVPKNVKLFNLTGKNNFLTGTTKNQAVNFFTNMENRCTSTNSVLANQKQLY